ncbi:hypothetical protein VNO78_05547 [Psophocarpus tetragonolobus]|uniref:Uncharacterized protein n=1 Tax=Psophocarpus tetragonolobus TaxID=3891 RepID=A0AAN9STU0_PSOTE
MFAFTLHGAKFDSSINDGRGSPTLRIQGQPCQRIGSLLPMLYHSPKFAQIYIFETENEIKNRIETIRNKSHTDLEIISKLKSMLDEHNTHAKSFRMARDRFNMDLRRDSILSPDKFRNSRRG